MPLLLSLDEWRELKAATTGQALPGQDALASASHQVGLGAGRQGCARDGGEKKTALWLVSYI